MPSQAKPPRYSRTLRGSARDEALRRLRSQEEFDEEDEAGSFTWSREYPKDHWSPLAALGGRQVIGNLRVEDDGTLRASARSLSMAARFAGRLTELLGEPLEVVGAEWRDPREDRGALEGASPLRIEDDERAEAFALEDGAAEPPSRNAPCWCGSGKKYKKCHLRQDEAT